MPLFSAVQPYTNEIVSISNDVNLIIKASIGMCAIILSLLGYIWNANTTKNSKTDDKVDKLVEQVAKLVTMMEVVFPEVKENTSVVNKIKENCASNHGYHKTKN